MESAEDNELFFRLELPHLGIDAHWAPTAGERGICRDIVRRVDYRVPSRETNPRSRYVTMVKLVSDALDVVQAAPSETLPKGPTGALAPSSLAAMLMNATAATAEFLNNGTILRLGDDSAREFADEIEPEILAFRKAIGIAGDGDATFWTIADPGETMVSSLRLPESRPDVPLPQVLPSSPRRVARRRFRWWNR